jgi:hydrogenase-4 component F
MPELMLLLGIPLLGAIGMAWLGAARRAPEANVMLCGVTLLAAGAMALRVLSFGHHAAQGSLFFADALNSLLVVLTTFVSFTTSLYSRPYMRVEADRRRVGTGALRLYHSMYQLFMFALLLALTTNSMGILWVAMEAATLATVLLVSLYRTPASIEAAWKYFILSGVGLALALFGTILLYLAGARVVGTGASAMLWTHLDAVKDQLEPSIVAISFVFLLVGYGTKVGLVPLHHWLPDAHAEGPTPISAVLSGLMLNVALYALVRCKVLVDGALGSHLAGNLMMGFGLLSVVVAAFLLSRQKDIKRLFAVSSIEHMGFITLAFGIGGAAANFAALLHVTAHSLVKSAIFFAAGHAAQKAGSQSIDDIRGLIHTSPAVGWGLIIGTLAILGLPPFGVFAAEFIVLMQALRQYPWVAVALLIALAVAFASVFEKVQRMVFGENTAKTLPHRPATLPVVLHLGLAFGLGVCLPPSAVAWVREAARVLG